MLHQRGVSDVRYTDAITLFEYGFNNFEKTKILDKNDYSFTYNDYNSNLCYTYTLIDDVYTLISSANTNIQTANYNVVLDYNKLKQYNIKSSNYINQVIGKINIEFRQNSSSYVKDFDLILTNISKIKERKTKKWKTTVTTVFIILLTITIISNKKRANNYTSTRSRKNRRA